MSKIDSNTNKNEDYSLYKKYFDNCDIEDDESIYKKQLYVLDDENFKQKDESTITLRHKSLLNRLILEDYSVYPMKKNPNEISFNNFKIENNNDKGNEKNRRKSITNKDNKKMDELEKFAEDENEFIKDLHRINYITFSPFSLSFFNKEDIYEKYKGRERSEKLMKEKEKEKKLFQMINFDYNKYEFNDDLLFNIIHGFVDVDKLKEENCINPFGEKIPKVDELGTNSNIKEEKEEKEDELKSGSLTGSEYTNSFEEEEEEEIEEEKEEEKEEKKDDIIVSELTDEINKFIKQRENIEFYKGYFEDYYQEKKKLSSNTKITDNEEKIFYREWIEKFKDIEILYFKYKKEQERLDMLEKEKIKRELREKENKRLKKEEDNKKFMNELNKIKRKTLIRLEEEKKQKIYFMTNDIENFKNNKRKSAIIPQKKNKDIEKLNNNKINKNKLKKSGTITDTKNERNDWMNQNKNNFFDDI